MAGNPVAGNPVAGDPVAGRPVAGRPAAHPRRRTASVITGLLAALAAVFAWGSAMSGTAFAEQSLISSDPAAGSTIERQVKTFSLTFAEPLGPTNKITASCGADNPIDLGPSSVGPDGVTVTAEVLEALINGPCTISYAVVDTAGNPSASGGVDFTTAIPGRSTDTTPAGGSTTGGTIGSTPAGGTAAPAASPSATEDTAIGTPASVSGPLGLGRMLSILGLAVLFGSLALIVLTWTDGVDYIDARKLIRVAWLVATIGAYLQTAGLAAQASGRTFGACLSPSTWTALDDVPGMAAIARLVLTVLSVWVAQRPDRVVDPVTRLAAIALPGVAVATFGLSRADGAWPMLGYLAGTVHALAMAVWFGGLVLLARVVLNGEGEEDIVFAVTGFGRVANVAVAATVLSGGFQLARLDGGGLFSSGHGRIILLKGLAVVAMVFIGTAARQYAYQRLVDADHLPEQLARRVQRTVGMEAGLGVAAVLFTAWAMSYTPPRVDATALPTNLRGVIVLENAQYTIEVALTQKVGPNALSVEVTRAEPAITALVVTFEPPPGSTAFGVVQPIPLTQTDLPAVLTIDNGLPLSAAGNWQVIVSIGGIEIDRATVAIDAADA